ncbi:MAG: endonuclease, partial [Acholeplasmataceae bacterium]|nr:endonuclease [Acholeplasmataceae bacterium]
EISRETLKYGSTVDFPEELIKEGYQLTGWTTDQAGEQLFNPSTTVTSNLTLYTKWTVISNSLEDLDYTGYGDYYLLLNDSDNVIHDLAILLRDTIDYVSYGDARYVYATYDNDSQVIMYDVPSSTSYRKVPATGTLGWGSGGVITTSEFTISINREHIWACSDMRIMPINKDKTLDGYVEFVINNDVNSFNYRPGNNDRGHYTDLHNLWNALAGPNGTHSDHFYGEESGPSVASYLSNDIFYPGDEYRGDVARALFYMTLMYPHLTLVERGDPNANEGSIYYGYLEDLLRWNEEDPVSYYELERNNTIFNEQGNRNPFIDLYDLDFAELLFAEGDPNVLD